MTFSLFFTLCRMDLTHDVADFEVQLTGEGTWQPFPNTTIIHTPVSD
jgi:hypothetical protein